MSTEEAPFKLFDVACLLSKDADIQVPTEMPSGIPDPNKFTIINYGDLTGEVEELSDPKIVRVELTKDGLFMMDNKGDVRVFFDPEKVYGPSGNVTAFGFYVMRQSGVNLSILEESLNERERYGHDSIILSREHTEMDESVDYEYILFGHEVKSSAGAWAFILPKHLRS